MNPITKENAQQKPKVANRSTLGIAAAFIARVAGTGLAFLFSVMLARLLGTSDTGVFFLALTIVTIGATVGRLGLDNAVLRFASVAHVQNNKSTMAALYRQAIGMVLVSGIVLTLLLKIIMPYLTLGQDKATELQTIMPVMLLALTPVALIMLQGEFFKSIQAPGIATVLQTVLSPLIMVAGLSIFFLLENTNVQDIALLFSIASIVTVILGTIVWTLKMPGLLQQKGHFNNRLLLQTSLPLLWVASMNLLMNWTDILVLGAWTNSATVGVYGVATRVAGLTIFVLVAVNSVTAPQFSALHAENKHRELEQLAQKSAFWMLLAILPIILILLITPEWVLGLFGSDFKQGASILRILAIGQLVNVTMGSVGYLLMMTGHERLMRNNIIFSAMVNLLGNLLLVPTYGAIGAAISTAFSLSLMNIISFTLVNKKLKINTLGYLFRADSCNSQ